METSARVVTAIDQLIELFNRRSDDLPDGLFDRRTQFLLNGLSFEERLGRSPSDPLVLMLARGPAGYRFALKAIVHAVPDARLQRGDIAEGTPTTVSSSAGNAGYLDASAAQSSQSKRCSSRPSILARPAWSGARLW